jgi:hypothetical protein
VIQRFGPVGEAASQFRDAPWGVSGAGKTVGLAGLLDGAWSQGT